MAKKFKVTTKTAIMIAVIAIVFVMLFANSGQTAKFYAAISPGRTTSSGTTNVIVGPSIPGYGLPAASTSCTWGQTRSCYTGLSGTKDVGVCKAGTQMCQSNGKWGTTCSGQITPSAEVCNDGKDNNCNGLTDCSEQSCDKLLCNTIVWNTNGIYGACNQYCSYADKYCTPCEITNWKETNCADGIDNEPNEYKDGLIDCADPDCNGVYCGSGQCQDPPSIYATDGVCSNSVCNYCV